MKTFQKRFMLMLTVGLTAAFFSCNNNTEKTEAPVKNADTTVAMVTPPAPLAFTPFDMVEISHTVKDYAKWRPAFNADSTARKASGLEDIVVGRGIDNSNNILMAMKVSDVQKAKAFAADPRLKDVMEKNGVTSKPEISYMHVLRFNAESNEKKWVMVTHKVKDFDAWLKVFDNEGSATRASQGLIDVVLARGIDDPNTVQMVFDITDMAKAKARMNDPELKKLMAGAGVEGTPKIEFYSTAE